MFGKQSVSYFWSYCRGKCNDNSKSRVIKITMTNKYKNSIQYRIVKEKLHWRIWKYTIIPMGYNERHLPHSYRKESRMVVLIVHNLLCTYLIV